MLPKVETEALGLVRSHGEQGQMPENMQGKEAPGGAWVPVLSPPAGCSLPRGAGARAAGTEGLQSGAQASSLRVRCGHKSLWLLNNADRPFAINVFLAASD